jgi:hypothetical protein
MNIRQKEIVGFQTSWIIALTKTLPVPETTLLLQAIINKNLKNQLIETVKQPNIVTP